MREGGLALFLPPLSLALHLRSITTMRHFSMYIYWQRPFCRLPLFALYRNSSHNRVGRWGLRLICSTYTNAHVPGRTLASPLLL